MRYVLDIAYKGTHYAGWQVQPNANTVQAELDKALSTLLRQPMQTLGAGRTDSGVHATQLLVHFDYEQPLQGRFFHSINGLLPDDIAVNGVYEAVRSDFHARFDATARAYRYQIVLKKPAIMRDYVLWVRQQLDLEAMQSAAASMMDYEDFASLCKAHGDNKTTLCKMYHAYFDQEGEVLVFHIKANRFLRGMVRATVGTLLLVGTGKISVEEFRQILETKARHAAGPNVLPNGLFLSEVEYPEGELRLIQHAYSSY